MSDRFSGAGGRGAEGFDRREFLTMLSAAVTSASLAACTRRPRGEIVPYVRAVEEIVPGKPLFFATAMPLSGRGLGLLVESHMGRPTKVEGNPQHPSSLGATDLWAQASTMGLYDPDRSMNILQGGDIRIWEDFAGALSAALAEQQTRGGEGLRILMPPTSSPSIAAQMQAVLARFPRARWHFYEPLANDGLRLGARRAFGRDVDVVLRSDAAERIVSIDHDFLLFDPGRLRHARDVAGKRRPAEGTNDLASMNRLYVIESTLSITGAKADHRLALRPSRIGAFARALAAALGLPVPAPAAGPDLPEPWIRAVADDLSSHRGASLVSAGASQPPEVHALALAINAALGNLGRTIVAIDPLDVSPVPAFESLAALASDMRSGAVDALLILGGNPAFDAPADLGFADLITKVPFSAHLSLHEDETSARCTWHVPEAHFLETWSDVRAHDGTVTIMQPLIAPIYGGRSVHEILALVEGRPQTDAYEVVRTTWRRGAQGPAFDEMWNRSVQNGVVEGTASSPVDVSLAPDWAASLQPMPAPPGESAVEIAFRPDPSLYDGRFATNAWLEELPRPITRITWDNAALTGPDLAKRSGWKNGDVIAIESGGASVLAPVTIVPGHADGAVTLFLGGGRTHAGRVGTGVGYDAYPLRTMNALWEKSVAAPRKTGSFVKIATTQEHHRMDGRDLARVLALEEFLRGGSRGEESRWTHGLVDPADEGAAASKPAPGEAREDLYAEYAYAGYRWGMAIDLSACIGCNACVVACQAENNIPVVGRDQVLRFRDMHWLRVDAYETGGAAGSKRVFQPVPCQQCEKAPCEPVCPVAATSHSSEGLNDMVYNRCVGTRYCSNNCPYKVRRFNFYTFADYKNQALRPLWNPDVTVRSRGVMEKCTYCVQRINGARIAAEIENRKIRDGEVRTACQSACPADAIVMGDLNDPSSRAGRLKSESRNYVLLEELNTQPRTSYLADIRNPNPAIEGA